MGLSKKYEFDSPTKEKANNESGAISFCAWAGKPFCPSWNSRSLTKVLFRFLFTRGTNLLAIQLKIKPGI